MRSSFIQKQYSVTPRMGEPRNIDIENCLNDVIVESSTTSLLPSVEPQPKNTNRQTVNVQTHSTNLMTSSVQVQTDSEKEINIQNVMGTPFKHRHTFSAHNKTLQLRESLVALTLPEEELVNKSFDCYATTFRDISEVYSVLDGVIDQEESVASPMVEYFFPNLTRLHRFSCVTMERAFLGQHVHVWKLEKNSQGKLVRTEVLPKRLVDVTDEMLDAYYEELHPGFMKIFIKSFGVIMCTECRNVSEFFQLNASCYTEEVDQFVKVTLYLLDPVYQLNDYKQASSSYCFEFDLKLTNYK